MESVSIERRLYDPYGTQHFQRSNVLTDRYNVEVLKI